MEVMVCYALTVTVSQALLVNHIGTVSLALSDCGLPRAVVASVRTVERMLREESRADVNVVQIFSQPRTVSDTNEHFQALGRDHEAFATEVLGCKSEEALSFDCSTCETQVG